MEPISSHAEHARKCLKVEYLGRIEYDFQKSRVTGPWDHMVSISAKKSKKNFMLVYLVLSNDDLFDRLETVLFFRLFTREGAMEYTGSGNTEPKRPKG